LKIFVGGNVNLAVNGVQNLNLDASKYSLFGLPTCTDISISGNASFTGSIYAPSANLDLNGSGTTIYDIVGAVVANDAYFHGNFQFHYDERLGRKGGKSQYRVAYWTEI
jgi:choice-of-anchor A domain-containing protein